MINVAVIGSGYWGKNLVRNFNELGVLHPNKEQPSAPIFCNASNLIACLKQLA